MTDKTDPGTAPPRSALTRLIRMGQAGRVVMSTRIRKALNVKDEQAIAISLEDDCIRLQTIEAGLKRAREIARRKRRGNSSLVDEFIAERRAEAAQD